MTNNAVKARAFKGRLGIDKHDIPVAFTSHVDPTGVLVLNLEEVALTSETIFILKTWHRPDDRIAYFRLTGAAEDGMTFETETLRFNSVGPQSDAKRGSYYVFDATCEDAIFREQLAKAVATPVLRLTLRGFRCFPQVMASSTLGQLLAGGNVRGDDPDKLAGYIQLAAKDRPTDLAAWRKDGEKLLNHVRQVMSFASGGALADPILNFFVDGEAVIHIRARSTHRTSFIPTIHPVGRDEIFQAAVSSFFNSPYKAKNLWMALEWFAMEATYNELRLVNAMTSLENLVNLNTWDVRNLLDDALFSKLRKALAATIKQFAQDHALAEQAPTLVEEMTAKLNELQRRSLRRKLDVLLKRWAVPMDGIAKPMVRDAFNARNEIVHEGRYYVEGETRPELWEHFCVVREIVTRIIFRALGFEGQYISHLGGYHQATFPPTKA